MPKKVFDNNNAIRSRLLLAELASATGATLASDLLTRMYTQLGEERFYTALSRFTEMVGLTEEDLRAEIDELGGVPTVLNAFKDATTFGLGPDVGNLYVMTDENLGTPAGEYKLNELVTVDDELYKVTQKSNLAGYVDWVFGIPNVSWIGAWEKIPLPSQSALEMALTPAEYEAFQVSGGNSGRRTSKKPTSSGSNNFAWILIGAAALFLFGRK